MFRVFTYFKGNEKFKMYKDFESEKECKAYAERRGWSVYQIETI